MTNHARKARPAITIALAGLLIALLGVLWSGSARAQSVGCTNRTLRGDYATVIEGQILAGPEQGLLRGLAMTHFDGEGNVAQVDFTTINGVAQGTDWSPGEGTYEVSPDCTGEATINRQFGPPLVLRLVVADHGTTFHTIVVGAPAGSTGTKIN
jgi:hypothetical protein